MLSVDRAAARERPEKIVADAKRALRAGRPIVIFPEGTRKTPGRSPPTTSRALPALYGQLGVACVPVALNSGLYLAAGLLK